MRGSRVNGERAETAEARETASRADERAVPAPPAAPPTTAAPPSADAQAAQAIAAVTVDGVLPAPGRPVVGVTSVWLGGLFFLLLGHAIYMARTLFLPILLAVLASLALSPVVRRLEQRCVPPYLSAALLLILLLGLFVGGFVALSGPVSDWVERAPAHVRTFERKLGFIKEPIEKVREAAETVEQAAGAIGSTKVVRTQDTSLVERLLTQTQSALSMVSITFVLLYFMLGSGDHFLRKLVEVVPRFADKRRTVEIVRIIEVEISRYLFTITAIYAALGVTVGVLFTALGVPNGWVWGMVAAVAPYIPYLGPITVTALLTITSLETPGSIGHALVPPLCYGVLSIIEGMFVTPLVLGSKLRLSPVIVFAGLLVWSWLWGIPGALIAVPALLAVKVTCDEIPAWKPIGHLMGN